MSNNEALERFIRESSTDGRRQEKFEESCGRVPMGYLNAYDVCRLWHNGSPEDWRSSPGTTAKELIAALGLPLMEVGAGRWVVTHTVCTAVAG
jgi:hypothetical protein